MRRSTDGKTAIIGCLVLIIMWPLSAIWSGYVLSVLWLWFAVPALDVPALSIPAAIGLAALVRYLTYQHKETDTKSKEMFDLVIEALMYAVGQPAFALAFGWVVSRFMN